MDVQRQAFEKIFKEKLGAHSCQFDLDEDGNYEDRETLCGWLMWQQAPKVAVPEGFVLVKRNLTNAAAHAAKSVDGRLSAFKYSDVWDAMIEAQEQVG
jgi:hypothetical protein